MTATDIITVIQSIGFPIFACCAMGWFCYYLVNQYGQVIDNNTRALDTLIGILNKEMEVRNHESK